jgi:hypothetical protein
MDPQHQIAARIAKGLVKTLVQVRIYTDGCRDWVEYPNKRSFVLGSTSVVEFLAHTMISPHLARPHCDEFNIRGETSAQIVQEKAQEFFTKVNRTRWYATERSAKSELVHHYWTLREAGEDCRECFRIAAEDMEEGLIETIARKARKRVKDILRLFKVPKILKALKDAGALSIRGFFEFVKKGGRMLAKALGKMRGHWIFQTPQDMPKVSRLLENVAKKAGVAGYYEKKLRPGVKELDRILRKYLPNLSKVALAAIFAFVWLNVDELTWDMTYLVRGFTGQFGLDELLESLPESAIGFLTGKAWGIGYTILPLMMLAKVAWMIQNDYLLWDGRTLKPNPVKLRAT